MLLNDILLLVLSHDLAWNDLWHLECKEPRIHSKSKDEPVLPEWPVVDPPHLVLSVPLMSASHLEANLIHSESSVLLGIVDCWSSLDGVFKHPNYDVVLNRDLSGLNVVL